MGVEVQLIALVLARLTPTRSGQRWNARVVSLPDVCHGKPRIRGTRITVSSIRGSFAAGFSRDEVLANYPGISGEDIDAALSFGVREDSQQ